jgi:hypothetical protein
MVTRIHRPLRIVAFNPDGIWRHRYELSKQLQGLHIDVGLFSETRLKPREKLFVPNYHFYQIDCYPERKARTAIAVRKGIPHMTSSCFGTSNRGLHTNWYLQNTTLQRWCGELLNFRNKYILAGDLYSRGWVDPVPDPLLFFLVVPGIEPGPPDL